MNRLFLLLIVAISLSSCGSAFRKEWKAAQAKPVPVGSIAGAWEGTWRSEVNGHTGKLRCVIPEGSSSQPVFHYHATWAKVFSGSMKAPHFFKPQGKGVAFTARHNLGSFGQFTAEGTISDQQFSATYQAAGDHGVFQMKRPE